MLTDKSLIVIPKSNSISCEEQNKYKKINSINYYQKSNDFLELLYQTQAVIFDGNQYSISKFILNNSKVDPVPRLLGYVAEGIIVRDCNSNLSNNRLWANYARKLKRDKNMLLQILKTFFYEPILENPDNYIAIGTGFTYTKSNYDWIYNPLSSRDICWLDKNNNGSQLLTIEGVQKIKQHFADLQVKISCGHTGSYVTNYFRSKPYSSLYPVVYFDLGDDFDITKEKVLHLKSSDVKPNTLFSKDINNQNFSHEEILESMLIRGRDIAPSLHEELLFYKHVIEKILGGVISLTELNDENIILSLIIEYVGNTLEFASPILHVPNSINRNLGQSLVF